MYSCGFKFLPSLKVSEIESFSEGLIIDFGIMAACPEDNKIKQFY